MATITDNVDSYLVQADNLVATTASAQVFSAQEVSASQGAVTNLSSDNAETIDLNVTNLATIKLIDAQGIEVDNLTIKQNGQIEFTSGLSLSAADQSTMAILDSNGSYANLELNNLVVKGRVVNSVEEIYNVNGIEMMFANTDNGGFPINDIEIVIDRGNQQNAVFKWDEQDKCWKLGLAGEEERIITSGHAEFDSDIISNEKIKFGTADGRPVISYYNNALNIESRDKPIYLFSGASIYANGGKILTTNSTGINATTINGIAISNIVTSTSIPNLDMGSLEEVPISAEPGSLFIDSTTTEVYQYKLGAWRLIGSLASNNVEKSVVTRTTSCSLTASDSIVIANASSENITLTLPPVSASANKTLRIKKVDSDAHTVTISASGTDRIDGQQSHMLRFQYQSVDLVCNGSEWYLF